MMKTTQIILAKRPTGTPSLDVFKFESISLPIPMDGEVLLEGLYYSVDPYMRGRMNDVKSYIPPFETGQPLNGGVVAKVLESKSSKYNEGDLVVGMLPWRPITIAHEKDLRKIDGDLAPPSYYLGVLGMPGLTAYIGITHIGKPKKGETVVISGAAGAVGLVAGQMAKSQGCRVIGIAGSKEKVTALKETFGFDEAINYKSGVNMKKTIHAVCPQGVDVYFDNVGGEISDAVIQNINFHARIVLCGQISLYNSTEIPMGPRLEPLLLTRSVCMQGFIITNYTDDFPEGIRHLAKCMEEGSLKFTETIIEGFDQLPLALLGLFKGENMGKMIVKR